MVLMSHKSVRMDQNGRSWAKGKRKHIAMINGDLKSNKQHRALTAPKAASCAT